MTIGEVRIDQSQGPKWLDIRSEMTNYLTFLYMYNKHIKHWGSPWLSVLRRRSSSQDYFPLTTRVVGSILARSENFMWERFQLLAGGRWFYSVWIIQRSSSTNKTGKVIKYPKICWYDFKPHLIQFNSIHQVLLVARVIVYFLLKIIYLFLKKSNILLKSIFG